MRNHLLVLARFLPAAIALAAFAGVVVKPFGFSSGT